MIVKLQSIVVMVRDQNAALDFYTKRVGLEKRTDVPAPPGGQRWVTVASKGQELEISLFQGGRAIDPKSQAPEGRPVGRQVGTFITTDCKKDFEDMKARGVSFNEEKPGEYPFGIVASFTDPDGNSFTLLQPAGKW